MKKLPIPEAVFDQHVITLGKTRSGKSSAMRLMGEHLLDEDRPVCIVDPKGDWWGIKASADGKSAGYPLVIFGGEHGDVPLNARSGGAVAELVATGNRSALIDLGGWMPGERTQFWIDFASTYFRTHKGRHWLVIDEVHNFCPKGKIMDPNAGKMLHWSNRLASEGLGKGIAMLAASQRPQKVHNDFLTSCETLIAMRVIHKADRDALKDWVDACGEPEKGREVLNTVAQNKRGEAWVYSPESKFGPEKIQFPMFRTYDSFKPQKAGEATKLKGWAEVNLADVTKKLEAVVKEAEANDPAKLKARIRELEKAKTAGKPVEVKVADPRAIQKAVQLLKGEADKQIAERDRAITKLVNGIKQATETLRTAAENALRMKLPPLQLPKIPGGEIQTKGMPLSARESRPLPKALPRPEQSLPAESNGDLPQGERAVLKAIAQYSEGVERHQITVLTGYKRSTRDAYVARLLPKEFIVERSGRIFATDAGIAALGEHYESVPPSGDELQAYWLERLPDGEKKLLKILLEGNGEQFDREYLTETTGYKRSTRDAYLARMMAKRIIEADRGKVKAVEQFFI